MIPPSEHLKELTAQCLDELDAIVNAQPYADLGSLATERIIEKYLQLAVAALTSPVAPEPDRTLPNLRCPSC